MAMDIAGVLQEALPYINYFVGKTVVVKMGGSALSSEHTVLQDIIWLKRIGKDSKTIKGLRVTDEETMEVVKMVLVGKVQQELVAMIEGLGGEAIGISGLDGRLFECERYTGDGDVGLGEGGVAYNINADLGAGELAAAMRAEKLIFLTDVEGIKDKDGQLISEL